MEMLPKYQLPGFIKFYSFYKFTDLKSKQTASLVLSYYDYAYHQMLSLSDTYAEFFKENTDEHHRVMFYLHKSWSYAFGMYALLRTTIEALSILRKMMGDMAPVSTYYQENIKRIIDIANNIVKHPTF